MVGETDAQFHPPGVGELVRVGCVGWQQRSDI